MPAESRYRGVPPGEPRPVPPTPGGFRHTVRQGDRLDRLAALYYGDPLAYWRICDANPEVLSPLALLGDDPRRTTFLPVLEGDPAAAPRALGALPGVRLAVPVEGGLLVTHNVLVTSVADVIRAVRAAGCGTGPAEDRGPVGSAIVIPPAGGA